MPFAPASVGHLFSNGTSAKTCRERRVCVGATANRRCNARDRIVLSFQVVRALIGVAPQMDQARQWHSLLLPGLAVKIRFFAPWRNYKRRELSPTVTAPMATGPPFSIRTALTRSLTIIQVETS